MFQTSIVQSATSASIDRCQDTDFTFVSSMGLPMVVNMKSAYVWWTFEPLSTSYVMVGTVDFAVGWTMVSV